jgi:hypothetical protein
VVDRTSLPDANVEASLHQTLRTIGSVVAPTTLLTALLFYFGWVSVSVQARYFGFDASLLEFSTQDYLLQSISPTFLPLGAALLVVLALLWGHNVINRWIGPGRAGRIVISVIAVIGLVLLLRGLVGILRPRPVDPFTPLGFAGGVGLCSYTLYLRRHRMEPESPQTVTQRLTGRVFSLTALVLSLFIGLSVVWVVAEYAEWDGRRKAERLVRDLAFRPAVVLYSQQRLLLEGPGVQEEDLSDAKAEYAYRYDGLRLLVRSSGRLFLLPAEWSHADGNVIVLRDREDVRVEFTTSNLVHN